MWWILIIGIVGGVLYVLLQEKGKEDKNKITINKVGKLDELILDAMKPSLQASNPTSKAGFQKLTDNEVHYQIVDENELQLLVFAMLDGKDFKLQVTFLNLVTNKKGIEKKSLNTEKYSRRELLGVIQLTIGEVIEQTL